MKTLLPQALANPTTHRSYTEPFCAPRAPGPLSRVIDALDCSGTRTPPPSRDLATRPAPQVMPPSPPDPEMTFSVKQKTLIRVRQVNTRGFVDDNGVRYLISPAVDCGAQGRLHLVRIETPEAGRLSEIWAAKQSRIDLSDVADVDPNASLQARARTDVAREFSSMRSVGSPMTPSVMLQNGDRIFAVSPLCDGNLLNLKPILERLDRASAELMLIDVAHQVAKCLVECRIKGVSHRDVKPENILFTRHDGQVFLNDFGHAVTTGTDELIAGTPGFIAPEHLFGELYDERIDIWSLGCTLLDMVNATPFAPAARVKTSEADSLDIFLRDVMPDNPVHAPLFRYQEWYETFLNWVESGSSSSFSSRHADLDATFAQAQQRVPKLFPLLMRMLAWEPGDRPNAPETLIALNRIESSAQDDAAVKRVWKTVARAPKLEQTLRRWCEPHLSPLRRTTSADNLVPTRKTTL